jgi:hypothetical protein
LQDTKGAPIQAYKRCDLRGKNVATSLEYKRTTARHDYSVLAWMQMDMDQSHRKHAENLQWVDVVITVQFYFVHTLGDMKSVLALSHEHQIITRKRSYCGREVQNMNTGLTVVDVQCLQRSVGIMKINKRNYYSLMSWKSISTLMLSGQWTLTLTTRMLELHGFPLAE